MPIISCSGSIVLLVRTYQEYVFSRYILLPFLGEPGIVKRDKGQHLWGSHLAIYMNILRISVVGIVALCTWWILALTWRATLESEQLKQRYVDTRQQRKLGVVEPLVAQDIDRALESLRCWPGNFIGTILSNADIILAVAGEEIDLDHHVQWENISTACCKTPRVIRTAQQPEVSHIVSINCDI